jgi:hypothetical protein
MRPVSANADDVHRIALSLPQVEQEGARRHYRVEGGNGLAWTWKKRIEPRMARVEQFDVFAIRVADEGEKQALIASDPEKFFTSRTTTTIRPCSCGWTRSRRRAHGAADRRLARGRAAPVARPVRRRRTDVSHVPCNWGQTPIARGLARRCAAPAARPFDAEA